MSDYYPLFADQDRVAGNIAPHIRTFAEQVGSREWHGSELHDWVRDKAKIAPASADRILRMMKRGGELNYEVVNRRGSLYRFIEH